MAKQTPLEEAQEMQTLLIDYAKQETLEPLKTLGRYLGFGIAGSLLMALGVFFTALATLRLAQSLDLFAGAGWASLGPYALTMLVLIFFILILYMTLNRAKRKVS